MESIFCLLLVVEAFSLQKVAEMLEEVLGERSGEYGEMRQNFVAQFVQLLKCWLCDVQSGIVMQKNWALSVEQCLLQLLAVFDASHRFAEHTFQRKWFLWDSESCSGSDWQQTTFFWCKFGFGKCFEASSSPTT